MHSWCHVAITPREPRVLRHALCLYSGSSSKSCSAVLTLAVKQMACAGHRPSMWWHVLTVYLYAADPAMLLSEAPDFLPLPMSDAHRPGHARKRGHHNPHQPLPGNPPNQQPHKSPHMGSGSIGPSEAVGFDYDSALRAAPGLDLAASGPASRGRDQGRGGGRRGRGRGRDSRGRAQGASFDGRQKTRKMVNPWAINEDEGSGPRGGGGGGGSGRRGGGRRGRGGGHEGGGGVSRNRSMPKAGNKSMNF